jgi:phospholipid-translocating ATPase
VTYVLQSAIIYFILLYGYFSPSARDDGYDVGGYEFSTAMVISAAIVSNLFNGLNTRVWTGWVFFSVFIGIILIWAYTVRPCLSTLDLRYSRSNPRL